MKRLIDDISRPVILIVGAGFGGLSAALRLIENGGTDKFQVILLDAHSNFTIGGLWQLVWNSRYRGLSLDKVQFNLHEAQLPGVDIRLSSPVLNWDPAERKVTLQNMAVLFYEKIILACGVTASCSSIPGLENHLNICTFQHVPRQQEEMKEFVNQAESIKQTFVLVITKYPYKCPVAPFEVIFLLEEAVRKQGDTYRDNSRFIITCPVEWPMPISTRTTFQKSLDERGIEFRSNHTLIKIDNSIIHFEDKDPIKADLIWAVYPLAVPDFVRKAIPDKLQKDGFVQIDDIVTHRISSVEGAYAIGDCCHVEAAPGLHIPKAGEFAWKMGQSVADDVVMCDRVSTDRTGRCIAEIGFDEALVVTSNFSDICNSPTGHHKIDVECIANSVQKKVDWANSYLTRIFGPERCIPPEVLESMPTQLLSNSDDLGT